ncbi:DUF421 domain-containing protein [Clostridium swellfunianum]|uniref:DUF421 domain-containing protein n=1 Tax=Clostridium swellfunianum TaxID=1367462 RepID=UPI00202E0FAD|nr:DUF421 domain-containing protein [Clostridium swellfunianum]MCM0646834.1 DUF421 domain-containing protein [Clostridium swellfunianum]
MFIVMLRTIILYFIVVITMRIMGKRQIGEMQPFELVIAIMVSELASLPMQDTRIPLVHGVIPIVTLLFLQAVISMAELKSEVARTIFSGKPSIIIKDGTIDIKQLKYDRFNINDLFEELRLQGYYNIEDIQYAILETSGQLSVIPKTELEPVTRQDMKIKTTQDLLPVTLVLDGKINHHNLKVVDKNTSWLSSQLKQNNIASVDKVFIALIDSKGKFFYQLKEGGTD